MTKISNQYSLTNILTADLANSRLGINNVSPTVALDVTGAGRVSSTLRLQGNMIVGSDTTQWLLSGVANGGAIWQKSNSVNGGSDDRYLRFGNINNNGDANYVMTIFNSNVGIGTTSPDALLTVAGANQSLGGAFNTYGNVLIYSTDSYAQNKGGALSLGGKYNSAGTPIATFARIHGKKENATVDSTSGYLSFETVPEATATLTEAMRINSIGRVGIGTNAPSLNLSVQGLYGLPATSGAQGTGIFRVQDSSSNISLDMGVIQYFGSWIQSINKANSSALTLALNPNGGNVGIGTSSPANNTNQTSLTINGALVSRLDMQVGGTRNAGFVVATDAAYLETTAAIPLVFYTNSLERMRIQASGNVAIGTTADDFKFEVSSTSTNYTAMFRNTSGSTCNGVYVYFSNSTSGTSQAFYRGESGAGVKAMIYTNGSYGSATGTYGSIVSDLRLKENISEATSKLNDILKLRVVNFNITADLDKKKQIGFIAQEFKEVFPSLVFETDTREYDKNGNLIKGLENAMGLSVGMEFAILTKAIQELSAKVSLLENK